MAPIYQHFIFSGTLQQVYLTVPYRPPNSLAYANLPPHDRPQIFYSPTALPPTSHFVSFSPFFTSGSFSAPPASSSCSYSLKVLQRNAGGFCAKYVKHLYLVFLFRVDLICIKEFDFSSSLFFWIPEYSGLKSDCTHFRSGLFSPHN